MSIYASTPSTTKPRTNPPLLLGRSCPSAGLACRHGAAQYAPQSSGPSQPLHRVAYRYLSGTARRLSTSSALPTKAAEARRLKPVTRYDELHKSALGLWMRRSVSSGHLVSACLLWW